MLKIAGALMVAGLMATGPLSSVIPASSASGPDPRVFGVNMPLFDGNEQLLSNAGTRQILIGWHTPVIRMPFRASLSDAVELQALQTIKTIGSAPLVIVHGAVDSTVLADDIHLLGLVAQVFGSSTVYVEYGNEEDLAGINDVAYTNSWNAVVPSLKSAHPTYKFIGPVNFQKDPTYIAYFVAHAVPAPDIVSWHEYVCSPTDATSICLSHIANWASHVSNTNSAEVAAVGHTFPFMITEWNMDPFNDPRYLDPTVIKPWTTQALQELNTLIPSGLIGAQQYAVDSHGGGFELIDFNNALTPQGQAFQAAMGGTGPSPLSVSASVLPSAGDVPATMSFTGTPAGGTSPYSYNWNFGDGTSATSQSPSHTYTAAGAYGATLAVTDATGAMATSNALPITVSPALSVSDSAGTSNGDAPLTVNFTSALNGGLAPYSYAWSFGDGGSSTIQSPSHTYTTAGTYNANLTVTDANGATARARALSISVNALLAATSNASPLAGDAPITVAFTGSGTGGTSPYNYSWAFGDGASSTAQNPSHSYVSAGSYSASLTVTDAAGHTASASSLLITVNSLLSATAIASPTFGVAPLAVNFTGTPTGGLAPYSYAWTFGDGSASSSQSPSHTYAVAGSYTASLMVTDAHGSKAIATAGPITISGPLAASAGVAPAAGDAPLGVSLSGSAAGGTSPYTYSWAFGDASTSTSQNPSHTYTTAGTYSAMLTVTDAVGGTATATATIVVSPSLSATGSASPSNGDAPLTVTFTGSSSGGKSPFVYAWDFGDGTHSSSQSPNHTYSAGGTYTATLMVTDANSTKANATALTIIVQPGLTVSAAGSPSSGDAPLAVAFLSNPLGGTQPYTYAWTFGDSTTSTLPNPSHTYTAAGAYAAGLRITDSAGHSAAVTFTVSVNPALVASASASTTSGDASVAIGFTGAASGGAAPYTYAWTFGDGTSSGSQNPSHAFGAPGTFGVSLIVTDNTGRTASANTLSIAVSPSLTAAASASLTLGTVPLKLNFTSTPNGGLGPYAYAWTFGDGAAASIQNPSHLYTTAGTYTARVTITDANGAHASATAGAITINGPLAVLAGAVRAAGDAPLVVAFSGSASGGVLPYSFIWAFGDGIGSADQNPGHTYTVAGTYTATLTVTDGSSRTATATTTVAVSPALGANATATPGGGVAPVAIAFKASASGGKAPFAYAWSFGDGGLSNSQNASHTYTAPGTYTAQLTIRDANGASAAASSLSITISPSALVASAVATTSAGDAPVSTTLSGSATGGTPPYSYAWNLGDGTSSNLHSVNHSYTAAGAFMATLIVSDAQGRSSRTAIHLTVYERLNVSLSATPTSGEAPLRVAFTGSVTGGLAPYSFSWDFADGSTKSGRSVTHSYGGGSFQPTLTVRDAAGGTWSGVVATVTARNAQQGGGAGAGNQGAQKPSGAGAKPTPKQPTPTAVASPPSSPDASSPVGGAAPPLSTPGSGTDYTGALMLTVVGSVLATGLGTLMFVGWRRLRISWLRMR